MTESEWLASSDPQAMLRAIDLWNHTDASRAVSDRKLRLFVEACRLRWSDLAAKTDLENQGRLMQAVAQWGMTKECVPASEIAHLLRDIVGNPFRPVMLPKGPAQRCRRCEGDGWVPTPDGLYASRETCKVCTGKGTLPLFAPCPWLTPTILAIAQAAYEERPGRKCKCGDGFAGRLADDDECACARCGRAAGLYGHYRERSKQMECPKCPTCNGTGRIEDGSLDPATLAILADALEDAGAQAYEVCPYCKDADFSTSDFGGPMMGGKEPYASRAKAYWNKSCACKGERRLPSPILAHLRSPGPHVRGCWALDCLLGKE